MRLYGDELHLTWKNPTSKTVAFLLLWLAGWSAGCGLMLYELFTDFEWFMVLFATPFFAAWFAVSGAVIYMLFGQQKLVIGRNELRSSSKALVTYKRRRVPIAEVALARPDTKVVENNNGPSQVLGIITLHTLGLPIQFAQGIKDDEAEWLAEIINTCLNRLAPNRQALAAAEALNTSVHADQIDAPGTYNLNDGFDDDFDESIDEGESTADGTALVFQPSRDRQHQPSDSRWHLDRSGRRIQLSIRGRWKLADLAAVTFINLFWNGIVGVFVFQLFTEFQWFLALFLTPFVFIGLLLMLALLASLTAPVWGMRYAFRLGEIERRYWGLGVPSTRRWEFAKIDRIEIRRRHFKKSSQDIPPKRFTDGGYQIAIIDSEEQLLTTIDALTKGEALWMADALMSERPEMFER